MIEFKLSPHIRALGFLYVRYVCEPSMIWAYTRKGLLDDEELSPTKDEIIKITMSEYIEKLLTDLEFYGTRLPRLPLPIE